MNLHTIDLWYNDIHTLANSLCTWKSELEELSSIDGYCIQKLDWEVDAIIARLPKIFHNKLLQFF